VGHWANCAAVRLISPSWFEHLEESFSDEEVQFKNFCLPVKSIFPPKKGINETPCKSVLKSKMDFL